MIKRYKIAWTHIIGFAKKPAGTFANRNESYAELLNIATILAFIPVLIMIITKFDEMIVLIIFLVLFMPLSRVGGWLTVNFYGYLFSRYLSHIIYRRFVKANSNDHANRRIATYASIGTIVSVLSIPYAWYLGIGLSIFLIKTGLSAYYKLTDKEAWVSATCFVVIWKLAWVILIIGISALISQIPK